MFALIFNFPAGRYHATPWGRHVNEGAVAWPPEPYRLLRALIAIWHRKADHSRWDESTLRRLIEQLATANPAFRLPRAVHAHARHYMPQARAGDTKLIIDAFYRLDPKDELVVAWPDLDLGVQEYALAEHLAELTGYLGRAESIVLARASKSVIGPLPVGPGGSAQANWISVDVLSPLSPSEYVKARPNLLALNRDKLKSRTRTEFEVTLPETLIDALRVETSELQAAGWSRPPAARLVCYARPEVGPRPTGLVPRPVRAKDSRDFQVARLIIAGRPRPSVNDAVKIGEVFRAALMGRMRRLGCAIPPVLSGRNEAGEPLRHAEHSHAFFLPEDHDEDGFIDHLVLYARSGLPRAVREAVGDLRNLWITDGPGRHPDTESEDGRREWRVALEGLGRAAEFGDSALLRGSKSWLSTTPYLRPRHLKRGDPWEATRVMIRAECERRGWPLPNVRREGGDGVDAGRAVRVGGGLRNVLAFHRFRSRRGLVQPDRTGLALHLEFGEPVVGPVALGFGCHFGLGLFRARE